MTAQPDVRIEKDSLGEVRIPANAYWGTTTQRALDSYPISGLRHHPKFIDAFIYLKKAAALANKEAGTISPEQGEAIAKACDEILAGALREQFVVDIYQMGAGTSFHMNVNEVLANRANELLGGTIGTYDKISPNDHVNFGQSTNDAFPTAMRLAILLGLRDLLHGPLRDLEASLAAKGKEFDPIIKSARTHLQDAVPIRLGQEFAAYGVAIRKCHQFLATARASCAELGIGGSAAGTGLNTAPGYRESVVEHLKKLTGIADLRPTDNLCEAMQSQRPVEEVMAALRSLAIEISRIANDLRLLASGPTTGLFEIVLPSIAPGSSIMPGKVNPSMPEMMNMVCFQVIGNATCVDWAVGGGQLELNVMMPVMAHNAIFSIHILATAVRQFTDLCVKGIVAKTDRCQRYAEASLGMATALNVHIGYKNAGAVAKEALATGKTVVEIAREKGLLKEEELKKVLDPNALTEPGIPGKSYG